MNFFFFFSIVSHEGINHSMATQFSIQQPMKLNESGKSMINYDKIEIFHFDKIVSSNLEDFASKNKPNNLLKIFCESSLDY